MAEVVAGGGCVNRFSSMLQIRPDELIIDSFAGGGGASLGIELALNRGPDIAINHDAEAITMHQANHPHTRHYCESVWEVNPLEATAGQPVGLAWFSPDCKHFSKAKGGKPLDKKIRGLAGVAIRWARQVQPRVIFVENVEEFRFWGALRKDGRPCPKRKGQDFKKWVRALQKMGYRVEYRELRACDYGAPTTRKRLFIIARRDGQPIVWPEATHGPGRPAPYRTAAECIDWSLSCPSIFERARPLAENTLRRIARGLKRYVIDSPHPYIVRMGHTGHGDAGKVRQLGQPLSTITSKAEHLLVSPTLVQVGYGERQGQAPRSLDLFQPLGTIVAQGQKHALVSAFLAKHYGDKGQAPGSDLNHPMSTVTSVDHHSLVTAHIQRDFGKSVGSPLSDSHPTITGSGNGKSALVTSNLIKLRGSLATHHTTAQDVREPVPTLTAGGTHLAEVRAFLIKYYGTDGDPLLKEPLHTVTTHDRFGLVTVNGEDYQIADIGLRMLAPRELFRAQGFPDSYQIEVLHTYKQTHRQKRLGETGQRVLSKTAQVRMCGNSVSPPVAAALVRANMGIPYLLGPSLEAWEPGLVQSGDQIPLFDIDRALQGVA